MRPALQKLLASPSALSVLCNTSILNTHSVCQHYSHRTSNEEQRKTEDSESKGQETYVNWRTIRQEVRDGVKVTKELVSRSNSMTVKTDSSPRTIKSHDGVLSEPNGSALGQKAEDNALVSWERNTIKDLNIHLSKSQNPPVQPQRSREKTLCKKAWREHLSTFEQLQYESSLEAPAINKPRLIDNDFYSEDWLLWLELIRFRRRHVGLQGMQAIYEEIFRRDKHIPTKGDVGKELWDLLFHAGHQDPKFLEATFLYATRLKRSTGSASPRIYGSIVGHALKANSNPNSVLKWHRLLKQNFAPSIENYKKLFKLSASWGSLAHFKALYNDYPLHGMYATVIPELCKLQLYGEAIEWHFLLLKHKELPLEFDDLKPLLAYFVQAGNTSRVEEIIRGLQKSQSLIIDQAAKYVRKNENITREMMNQKLGEVYGVSPKQLSDSFCARLFATKLFAVKSVISGLQMMAVKNIGPFSLREIAYRDECHPPAILRHLDDLKDAGISLDESMFSTVLQRLIGEENNMVLKSLVESDLHPDTLEDWDLQEKLLAQYYAAGDQLQVERTLAILTARSSSQQERATLRWNCVLRSHVTLRRINTVKSIIGTMQRFKIAVTSRSSRHLRVHWLTRRQRGHRAEQTEELSIIIRATQSTLKSGGFVPIIAWREIMRRLGMAGRLIEFENLALWLADYYASPAGQQSMPTDIALQNGRLQQWKDGIGQSTNHNPQKYLNVLFTIDAQHAIVAWGFQQEVKMNPEPSHASKSFGSLGLQSVSSPYRPLWIWGLVLLRKLQERGVPIQQATISRICRHRLAALFGLGISNRPINRRTKWINDMRARAIARYMPIYYVREMEDIWGQDLFRHQIQWTRGFRHRRSKRSVYWSNKIEQAVTGQDWGSLEHRKQRDLIHGEASDLN